MTNGVPTGYTRDEVGAATAAVNGVQLLVAVTHGQADRDTALAAVLASGADAAVRDAFDVMVADSADRTTKTPLSARVLSHSDAEARVDVWIASTGTTTAPSQRSAVEWSTSTVQLVWETNDWKVTKLSTRDGPAPGDPTAAAPQPVVGGLYTFYVN